MGSDSDSQQMRLIEDAFKKLHIGFRVAITSAHRTPKRMTKVMDEAERRGFKVIIAGAGGSAHLQGMSASETPLPVLGVAIKSSSGDYSTMAAVFSCIVMPKGVPLPFMGIGEAGAHNAALQAARILALSDRKLAGRLKKYIAAQTNSVPLYPQGWSLENHFPKEWF